jgi:hypothetical protein
MSSANDPCLCCPDCGCALQFDTLTNGQITCQCADSHDCRAGDWITCGRTRDEAADKFVQKCERYGYLTALEEKLANALQWEE